MWSGGGLCTAIVRFCVLLYRQLVRMIEEPDVSGVKLGAMDRCCMGYNSIINCGLNKILHDRVAEQSRDRSWSRSESTVLLESDSDL